MLVFCINYFGNCFMRTQYIAILLVLMLQACGLKGPLYLPQDSSSEIQESQVEGQKSEIQESQVEGQKSEIQKSQVEGQKN